MFDKLKRKNKKIKLRNKKLPRRSSRKLFDQNILIGIFGFILIAAVLIGFRNFISSPTFAISQFNYIGNNKAQSQDLDNLLSNFSGNNIFLLRTASIIDQLKSSNYDFEQISIRKILPNELEINIIEKEPDLTLINLNGIYLLSSDGKIIEVILTDETNFDSDDLNVLKGVGDPDSKEIRRILKEEFKNARDAGEIKDEQQFDFSKVSNEEKLLVLSQMQAELELKSNQTLKNYNRIASRQEFAGLPRVFSIDNQEYQEGDTIDRARIAVTFEARKFFTDSKEYIIRKIHWESPYSVKFFFTSGQKVIFGTKRSISVQIEDFLIITNQRKLQGKSFRQMDLSSRKVSVK